MVNRVVVAMRDGTRQRGYVYDVSMERGDFHLYASDDPGEAEGTLVTLAECKAVYFVKSLTGNPNYEENKTELTDERRLGRAYEVIFGDGERIVGTAETYHPEKLGFYLIPPDPGSNNLRIFVVAAHARSVKKLDANTGEGGAGTLEAPDPATYPDEKRIEVVLRLLREGEPAALAKEVLIPLPVLEHWKGEFLAGVRTGVSEEGLAAMRLREDPGRRPDRRDRTPVEKRLDLVLRLLRKEDAHLLSQTTLVPERSMEEWRDRGVAAGKDALRILGSREAAMEPGEREARYRALLEPPKETAPSGRPSFLDSLPGILKNARKGAAR